MTPSDRRETLARLGRLLAMGVLTVAIWRQSVPGAIAGAAALLDMGAEARESARRRGQATP